MRLAVAGDPGDMCPKRRTSDGVGYCAVASRLPYGAGLLECHVGAVPRKCPRRAQKLCLSWWFWGHGVGQQSARAEAKRNEPTIEARGRADGIVRGERAEAAAIALWIEYGLPKRLGLTDEQTRLLAEAIESREHHGDWGRSR